jgi:meiotically up-regulated gene 157 (Mug157) protein
VLLWRTFTRLHTLFIRLGTLPRGRVQRLDELAAQVKKRTIESFKTTHTSCVGNLFAYQTDACGNSSVYHDANDIPTLFASEWGFASTPDEIQTWRNTMTFGLSPANTQGYCNESPYDGLGSVHSPGAWPLGYFHALAYAALTDDSLQCKVHGQRWQQPCSGTARFPKLSIQRQHGALAKLGSAGPAR